jgi:MFS family permease
MTFGIYGMIFLVPLVWQSSGLLSARGAGLGLLPCAVLFFLIAPRSGHLARCIGVCACTAGATAVVGCGLLVLGLTHLAQPLGLAWFGLGLTGIGMGINTGPLMSVAVDAVGPERSGTASSIINVARMVGATLGVAVLGAAHAFGGGSDPGFQAVMLTAGGVQLVGPWWRGGRSDRPRPSGRIISIRLVAADRSATRPSSPRHADAQPASAKVGVGIHDFFALCST